MDTIDLAAAWDDCYLQCYDCHDTFIWKPRVNDKPRCLCGSERLGTPAGLADRFMAAMIFLPWTCPKCETGFMRWSADGSVSTPPCPKCNPPENVVEVIW